MSPVSTCDANLGNTATMSAAPRQAGIIALFGFTVFCSAFLLFQIQLIIAKYILPWFGGTPATFTTCILFFQMLLLFGYFYAHFIDVRLSPRSQAVVHSLLILLAITVLVFRLSSWGSPLLPDSSWKPVDSDHPLLRILGLLSASVALPYFLVSTTGPLLQAWYGRICGGAPYRLYALSNSGSLIALLSYPVVVEPLLPLRVQAHVWAAGFVLFGAGCIAIAWRAAVEQPSSLMAASERGEPREPSTVSWNQKAIWLLLAAAGSLSLLATTNRICQDVAVVPLLWVLPLSLYLLSFVACFSSDDWYSRPVWSVALGLATLLICFVLYHPETGILRQIFIYSFALLASCMVCHGELVRLKPPKEHLTSFYLYVAAGGALGGFFVSIIAPYIFKGFWEFHLSVWLCWVLFFFILLRDAGSWIYLPKPVLLAFSVLVLFAGPGLTFIAGKPGPLLLSSLVTVALIAFMWSGHANPAPAEQRKRVAVFSISFTSLLLAIVLAYPPLALEHGAIETERNFYGVLSVVSDTSGGSPRRVLHHGKVTHGFQFSEDSKRRMPTSYYAPQSGIGLALADFPGRASGRTLRIGVIGLGVGTIAAYGIPGDSIRFYEINPEVIRIAGPGSQQMFTFLSDSRADVKLVPGDARISLEQELKRDGSQKFDVLVVDAFNGDAIPVHLLTREAFQLYRQHLNKPDGILAFHISNDALDLRPVVAKLSEETHMSAWLAQADPPYRSIWVIVSALDRDGPVPGVEHMTRITPNPHFPVWTDDYSNLLQVLRR